jgi:hypothetical protein
MFQFKASPEASKPMLDNPQDRTGPNQKLLEGFGGKLLAYYVYPPGECDGTTMVELPDEMSARGGNRRPSRGRCFETQLGATHGGA